MKHIFNHEKIKELIENNLRDKVRTYQHLIVCDNKAITFVLYRNDKIVGGFTVVISDMDIRGIMSIDFSAFRIISMLVNKINQYAILCVQDDMEY